MRNTHLVGILVVCCAAAESLSAPPLTLVRDMPGTFIDISATGQFLDLADDGEIMLTTTKGNDVILPGSIIVGNNGGVGIGQVGRYLPSGELDPMNGPLPNLRVFGGGKALTPGHDNPGTHLDIPGSGVYFQEFADRWVVEWRNLPVGTAGETVTFEVQVFNKQLHFGPGPEPECFAQFFYVDFNGQYAQTLGNFTIGFQDGPGDRPTGIWNTVEWDSANLGIPMNGDILSLCPSPGGLGVFGLALAATARRRR